MPKPKVDKLLAYRKCQQCRKDRQKCTPVGRSWPGRRCDRCQRYDYACSANRTKNEEIVPSNLRSFTLHDAGSEAPSPRYLPELRSVPQGDAESEARCLQKLGDCHRMLTIARYLDFLDSNFLINEVIRIREVIDECAEDITVRAEIHQAQGRYKDAEYLYRQMEAASTPLMSSHDSLLKPQPDMVLIYEKLGNLPAAEILQQHRLLFLMRPELGSEDAIISREAENLFRLYTLFLARVEDLDVISPTGILLTIFYRIAILGCSLLNALLFKSELWTRYDHELCLHIAIRVQSTEMIRGLISIGVDVDGRYMPLLSAVQYGNLDGLELLLDNNVDVGVKRDDSSTALHLAMFRESKQRNEIIYRLIEAGVEVNALDSSAHTALQSAVIHSSELDGKVVRCLVEAGLNIEAEDWNKDTALCLAVKGGYLTAVQLLLQQGVNIEAREYNEETPLFCAVRYIDVSMAKLLLNHGANIEARDRVGRTPLHMAVTHRRTRMVEILLKGGASVIARDMLGHTPVNIARLDVREGGGDHMLLDMLLEYES